MIDYTGVSGGKVERAKQKKEGGLKRAKKNKKRNIKIAFSGFDPETSGL